MDHNKLWKTIKEMVIQDHLTYLLRNLYVGQEVTEQGLEQWTDSKLGKEYVKDVYHHSAYLTYTQITSCDAELDEAQAGINTAERNINNLRYADCPYGRK